MEGRGVVDCDGVDDSEEYRISVAVAKRGGRLEVDFSGTSRQARTCINATALDVKTTVGHRDEVPVRPVGHLHVGPVAERRHRPARGDDRQRAAARRGRVPLLRAEPGDAVRAAAAHSPRRSARLRWPATGAGPTSIPRSARSRTARRGYPSRSAAARSARSAPTSTGTAIPRCCPISPTGSQLPRRRSRRTCPWSILRHEIVADSAGPGYNRGGASVVRDSLWLEPAHHSLMTLRAKRAAGFGVNGGGDGRPAACGYTSLRADGTAPQPALGPDSYRDCDTACRRRRSRRRTLPT